MSFSSHDSPSTAAIPSTSQSGPGNQPQTRPKHIRPDIWEKFLALQKRTDEATKKSSERRLNQQKRHEKSSEVLVPDQQDQLPQKNDAKARKRKNVTTESSTNEHSDWKEVRSYLNVNDHLKGIDLGRDAPKSRLELGIDDAVALGDYDLAESLSDDLAKRNFGEELTKAFDARDYTKKKKMEGELKESKMKKKLYWGFNQKQNWEMKSNM